TNTPQRETACPLLGQKQTCAVQEPCPLYARKRTSELGLRYVRRNSSGSLALLAAILVARQQLDRRSPAGFVLGKLLPVVVAHETMHGGVHVAVTMLPNSRTTLWTSITGKSGAPRYSSRTQKTHQRRSRDEGCDNLLPRQ